jgi:hypothetical protein
MAPYLMNHYLRRYLIKIWCVLFNRHHTFDVKACFQQNRYVFDVIVTSWALFVFCISWNFARDIYTVFEEIKHLRSRAPVLFSCYITVTCRHTIVFTANIASQTSKRHLIACNIWTFSRRFSRNLTPRAPKKYINSSCVLFILIIW